MATVKYIPSTTQPEVRNYMFSDIEEGVIFRPLWADEDDLFIKTSFGISDCEYSAVSLTTGEAIEVDDFDEIEIIRAISFSEDDIVRTIPVSYKE
jgi:F0F1-type ATP synthase epsilon subunit